MVPRQVKDALRWAVRKSPRLKRAILDADVRLDVVKHSIWERHPSAVRARTTKLTVAVTAACNQRCIGCRYGRDFMPGHELPLRLVEHLLDDAKAAGVQTVRLYGGEPLLHPHLPAMVRRAVDLGLSTYVTTNGVLLGRRIDELYDAGLRGITIGFYGTGEYYDTYVQRRGQFRRLEESVAAVRERYGDEIGLQLNFLIMKESCSLEALHRAWEFADRFRMSFHTDLIHYSLPYFTEGPDRELQFAPSDRPAVEELVAELLRLKNARPEQIPESAMSLRSIPDWLFRGADMRIPCDAYKLIWVGADGTVQLCYVTFKLGNLHERRLRDMLYTAEHHQAARDAFCLECPNCHCERNSRILKHAPSRRNYA